MQQGQGNTDISSLNGIFYETHLIIRGAVMKNITIIIVPGNGYSSPQDNWTPYAKAEFEKLGYKILTPQFPDLPLAREKYWLPFLKELGADENTIFIGHSTGAIAAMRFAEKNKLLGSVLVGAYVSDLGIESEKLSGYFDRPWNWQAIKDNQQFIIQFASVDDPWIPIEEPRELHKNLNTEYYEYSDQGHFMTKTFPELVEILKKKI